MTHVQPIPRTKHHPVEDPQLLQMMATHVHCGEVMQLVSADPAESGTFQDVETGGALLTYRCACGFSFDQEAPARPA